MDKKTILLIIGVLLLTGIIIALSGIHVNRLESIGWGPSGSVHLGRGESYAVTIWVSKWSKPVNVTFTLENIPDESTGIHVDMPQRTVYVDQTTSATLRIIISADKNAIPGDYTMTLKYQVSDGLKGEGPISLKVLHQTATTTIITTIRTSIIESKGLYPVIYNNWWMIPIALVIILLSREIIKRRWK